MDVPGAPRPAWRSRADSRRLRLSLLCENRRSLQKEVYAPAAGSILPSAARARGCSLFLCSQFLIFLCFKKKKNPPQSSYTHKSFRFKPLRDPGTKAASINHPLQVLGVPSSRPLSAERQWGAWSQFLAPPGARDPPPPRRPGDTHRAATILGPANACHNLRHLGRSPTSPSNTLASLRSHVFIWFYFWPGREGACLWLLPGSFVPGLPATAGSAGRPRAPSAPRAPQRGPAGPRADDGLRDGWAGDRGLGSILGKRCGACTGLPAPGVQPATNAPSVGLAPGHLSPKPGRTGLGAAAALHTSLCARPSAASEARGFLRSRKLLLPSRPQHERGRCATGLPAHVLQRAAPQTRSVACPRPCSAKSPRGDRRGEGHHLEAAG